MPFPRTVIPEVASRLWLPGAAKDIGHSGGIQVRAMTQIGWSWREKFPLLSVSDIDHMELMAIIDYYWNRGIIDTITHPLVPGSGRAPNGAGGGTPLVNGAGQTGDSINIDGASNNITNWAVAGDAFTFAGDLAVYRARANADSNGVGQVVLPITPNLRVSPADGAAVTREDVDFTVVMMGKSRFEENRSPNYYANLQVVWSEAFL